MSLSCAGVESRRIHGSIAQFGCVDERGSVGVDVSNPAAHQSSAMNRDQGRLKTIFWLISFSEGPIQA